MAEGKHVLNRRVKLRGTNSNDPTIGEGGGGSIQVIELTRDDFTLSEDGKRLFYDLTYKSITKYTIFVECTVSSSTQVQPWFVLGIKDGDTHSTSLTGMTATAFTGSKDLNGIMELEGIIDGRIIKSGVMGASSATVQVQRQLTTISKGVLIDDTPLILTIYDSATSKLEPDEFLSALKVEIIIGDI